jgi:hypothetical protein
MRVYDIEVNSKPPDDNGHGLVTIVVIDDSGARYYYHSITDFGNHRTVERNAKMLCRISNDRMDE